MNDLRELKEGDTIAFKKPSGNASITRVPNKGFYFNGNLIIINFT